MTFPLHLCTVAYTLGKWDTGAIGEWGESAFGEKRKQARWPQLQEKVKFDIMCDHTAFNNK